jgi:hypothetical protein
LSKSFGFAKDFILDLAGDLTFDVFFFTLLALGIFKLNSRQYIQQIKGVK